VRWTRNCRSLRALRPLRSLREGAAESPIADVADVWDFDGHLGVRRGSPAEPLLIRLSRRGRRGRRARGEISLTVPAQRIAIGSRKLRGLYDLGEKGIRDRRSPEPVSASNAPPLHGGGGWEGVPCTEYGRARPLTLALSLRETGFGAMDKELSFSAGSASSAFSARGSLRNTDRRRRRCDGLRRTPSRTSGEHRDAATGFSSSQRTQRTQRAQRNLID
jgi:hypothetical protein